MAADISLALGTTVLATWLTEELVQGTAALSVSLLLGQTKPVWIRLGPRPAKWNIN